MSCINSSAKQKCKKRVCTKACCTSKSQFFTGPRTLLQDLSCGSNCNAALTVEAWSGGQPDTPGATGTTVGLELCDKLVFWSNSLDLSVEPGSAVVNIESDAITNAINVPAVPLQGSRVYKQNTGTTLVFRSLFPGDGINIVENTDDITIGLLPVTDIVTVNYSYIGGTSSYNTTKTWPIYKIGNIVYLNITEDLQGDMTGFNGISMTSGVIPINFIPTQSFLLPLKLVKNIGIENITATIHIISLGSISITDTGTFGNFNGFGGFANTVVSWIV